MHRDHAVLWLLLPKLGRRHRSLHPCLPLLLLLLPFSYKPLQLLTLVLFKCRLPGFFYLLQCFLYLPLLELSLLLLPVMFLNFELKSLAQRLLLLLQKLDAVAFQ